jgi:hypothetical protein
MYHLVHSEARHYTHERTTYNSRTSALAASKQIHYYTDSQHAKMHEVRILDIK